VKTINPLIDLYIMGKRKSRDKSSSYSTPKKEKTEEILKDVIVSVANSKIVKEKITKKNEETIKSQSQSEDNENMIDEKVAVVKQDSLENQMEVEENKNVTKEQKITSEEKPENKVENTVGVVTIGNKVVDVLPDEEMTQNIKMNELDMTDSQLCNVDEKVEINKKPAFVEEDNFGIEVKTVPFQSMINNLKSMNQLILGAKKEIAAMRLKLNQRK